MKKRVTEVVAAVIFDRGKLLCCQRPAGKAHAGKWEFPGGKLEPGETPAQALTRELAEELALPATPLDVMYRLVIEPEPERELVLHFVRALVKANASPRACENQQFCWLAPEELGSVDFLSTDQEFIEYLKLAYCR